MSRSKPSKEQVEALKKKEAHWKGQYRYLRYEDGAWHKFPGYVATPHYTNPDHKLRRQVCKGLDPEGNLVWVDMPDAPEAPKGFDYEGPSVNDESHLVTPTPPFDWRPPAYNSDTHSGGPANFDGNAGGANNPRIPAIEGEVAGEHKSKLAEFQEALDSVNQ